MNIQKPMLFLSFVDLAHAMSSTHNGRCDKMPGLQHAPCADLSTLFSTEDSNRRSLGGGGAAIHHVEALLAQEEGTVPLSSVHLDGDVVIRVGLLQTGTTCHCPGRVSSIPSCARSK